jgi:phosphomannomutase
MEHLLKLEQLKFGTSGLRGSVNAFRPEDCFCYAVSFARLLSKKFPMYKKVSFAGDLRASTPLISQHFVMALESEGLEIEYLGFIPTPALAFWANEKSQAAVMVTGSHIPADQNGVKFYTPTGEITKEDEAFIHLQYQELKSKKFVCKMENQVQLKASLQKEAENFYLKRYVDFFRATCLKGLRIAFYQHSGVGREVLPLIFRSLGADVVCFGLSTEFIPVDTENVKNISHLQMKLKEMNANILLSTDGDADRPLVIDEKYGLVRGDILGIVTSQLLAIRQIATPVSSTSLIEETRYFTQVERTKIGSPFVITGLEKLLGQSSDPVAGFEANGGYLLARNVSNQYGDILKALMTRDCALPMIAYAASKSQSKLETLFLSFGSKANLSGLVPEFPREISAQMIEVLKNQLQHFLSEDKILLEKFGNPKAVNLVDGVQILSHQMETLHFRASGNAPEFRVYVEANSQPAADDYLKRSLGLCKNFLLSANSQPNGERSQIV